jgi:hypothetical protein
MFSNKLNEPMIRELIELSYTAEPRLVLLEGWSEFMRHWMTNPTYAMQAAPNMVRWIGEWANRAPEGPALLRARDQMTEWLKMNALDRARSKQGYHADIGVMEGTPWQRYRQSIWDDLEGFAQMERDLTGRWTPDGGVYQTARLTRGKGSVIMGAIRYGAPEYAPEGYIRFNGPGLDHGGFRFLCHWKKGKAAQETRPGEAV